MLYPFFNENTSVELYLPMSLFFAYLSGKGSLLFSLFDS